MKHVVMCSSGAGSAVAGRRVVERYGPDDVTLLFADVNGEDEDNYRFLDEVVPWIGAELVVIDNDGRTIWDVFRKHRFLGNTRVDLCSRVLKREPMLQWLVDHRDPGGHGRSHRVRLDRGAPGGACQGVLVAVDDGRTSHVGADA